MSVLKHQQNIPVTGKQVFTHAGKNIGVVTSVTECCFDVQRKWFGSLRAENSYLLSQIHDVDEYRIILQPSNDEYWQSPGGWEEPYEGRYFVMAL